MRFIDLTGQRFGRLIVIERAESRSNQTYWKCRCDCGNEKVVDSYNLRKGLVKSCGCCAKGFPSHITHGLKNTKTYHTWTKIKGRCFDVNNNRYEYYGRRGITVCAAWKDDFQAFYDYVSKLDHFNEQGYSLDRIDNNGNYEPNNLRWADQKAQCRNRRNNVIVEYNGEQMTLPQAAALSGLSYGCLKSRYHHGDRGDYLFRPSERRKQC